MAKKQSKKQSPKGFVAAATFIFGMLSDAFTKAANAIHESEEILPVIKAVDAKDWESVSRLVGLDGITNRIKLAASVPCSTFNTARINDLVIINRAGVWALLGEKRFQTLDGENVRVSVSSVGKHARAVMKANGTASIKMKPKTDPLAPLAREIGRVASLEGMMKKRAIMTILSGLISLDILDENAAAKLL